MKRSNMRRCLLALIAKNQVLLILFVLFWPIALLSQLRSFSAANLFGQFFFLATFIYLLWDSFFLPCYELLIRKSLIERTVHVNYARTYYFKSGPYTDVKTCEIREGLSYHEPIPDDMIVNNRLTIGYLPKSCIILYVDKPTD